MNNRLIVSEYFQIKCQNSFEVESNGDIRRFTLTGVSNIRKDKNEPLVTSNQAINRLYHEDLIPKNCRVRTTLGYYTYISQTENQVLIPTWNVEISDKDGQVSNYYVDAINLNILNRKGQSSQIGIKKAIHHNKVVDSFLLDMLLVC